MILMQMTVDPGVFRGSQLKADRSHEHPWQGEYREIIKNTALCIQLPYVIVFTDGN